MTLQHRPILLRSVLLLSFFITFGLVLKLPLSFGIDYLQTFRPAVDLLFHGESPYTYIYNPPWVLLPFVPLALLPAETANRLWFLASTLIFGLTFHRLGVKPIAMALCFLSPPFLFSLMAGNVESLVLLGFTLPPVWGLFLVALKPQIGLAVAVFWATESYREGGLKKVVQVFTPFAITLLASFLVFGLWPLRMQTMIGHAKLFNLSFWPFSLPIGLAVLGYAIYRRNGSLAMVAGPLLSPYALLYSWTGLLAGLSVYNRKLLIAVISFFWGLALLQVLRSVLPVG